MSANNSQQAFVSLHFFHGVKIRCVPIQITMLIFLLLELGFRSIQWLGAMDYEGLLKEVSKKSHHTKRVDVCVICPTIQDNVNIPLNIIPNRKPSKQQRVKETDGQNPTWTTVMQGEQIHCNEGSAVFPLQANNWEQYEHSVPFTDSLLD